MSDVHSETVRSRNMAAIRSKNTQPEMRLRRALFSMGFRYRLHDRRLAGRPDMVFPKFQAAIFVHGCFFHGHECAAFRWPLSRADWWRSKILANRARDAKALNAVASAGWRHLVVWECALKGGQPAINRTAERAATWLRSKSPSGSISGPSRD